MRPTRVLLAELVRVAVVPVALVGQAWAQPPGAEIELLEVVFPVATAYALLTLASALSGRRTAPAAVLVPADTHPRQRETLGLAAGIRAVAEQKGRAGGFTVDVVVRDDAVGVHDELLLALARELLQNVAKHADARRVRLDVRPEMDALVLRCTDDGRGFRTPAPGAALDDGHLGLAACTERVEAVGGVMEVRSAPGRGTVVRAALPPNALLRSSRSFNRVP